MAWYKVVKANQLLAAKVVRDYTEAVPQSSPFFGLSELEATQLLEKSAAEVDDLTVLALVSLFEQLVLDYIRELEERMKGEKLIPIMGLLEGHASKNIERWRFTDVLELFEFAVDSSLLDQVKNIYRYRNWVAHGKRKRKPVTTDPIKAHEALSSFLGKIDKITES